MPLFVMLVDYFFEHVVQPHAFGTTDYNIGRHRIKQVIEDAMRSYDVSDDMLIYLRSKGFCYSQSSPLHT